MRTRKELYPQVTKVYTCELETCPKCGSRLVPCDYYSGDRDLGMVHANREYLDKLDFALAGSQSGETQ